MCENVSVWVGGHSNQRVLNPLELEVYTDVSCLMWMLRSKLWSSGREESALNF